MRMLITAAALSLTASWRWPKRPSPFNMPTRSFSRIPRRRFFRRSTRLIPISRSSSAPPTRITRTPPSASCAKASPAICPMLLSRVSTACGFSPTRASPSRLTASSPAKRISTPPAIIPACFRPARQTARSTVCRSPSRCPSFISIWTSSRKRGSTKTAFPPPGTASSHSARRLKRRARPMA